MHPARAEWHAGIIAAGRAGLLDCERRPPVATSAGVAIRFGVGVPVLSTSAEPAVIELCAYEPVATDEALLETLSDIGRQIAQFVDRRAAESQLRTSEIELRTAFASAPIGMGLASRDGRWLQINDAYCTMLGYTASELAGRHIFEFTESSDRERAEAALHQVVSGVAMRTRHEQRYVATHETFGWASVDIAAVYRDDSELHHLIVQAREITAEKVAEEEQLRLNQLLRTLAADWRSTFDAVETPIVIVDDAATVRRLNRAAATLAAIGFSDIVGHPLAHGRDEPWLTAASLVSRLSRIGGTSLSQRVSDATRHWQLTVSKLVSDEEPARFIVVFWETTRIIELQEGLRKAETLSEMGALVAGVAHEVRNPLFAISATVDALEAKANGAFEKYVRMLRNEVNRMSHVMHELLEYARPARLELSPQAFDGVVAHAVRSCLQRAQAKAIEIEVQNVPGVVSLLDPDRMQQVLQNVIENAIEHAPEESTIAVTSMPFVRTGETWLRCSIRDHGQGFGEADLARVFEPFYTRRRGGTGLGLSIVQRIVFEHAGLVHAANAEDGGAVVTIELPVIPLDARA